MTHINRKRIISTVDVDDQNNNCSVPDKLLTFVANQENNTLGFNMNQRNDREENFFHGLAMNGHLPSPLASSSRHHPTSFIKVFLSLSLVLLITCNLFLTVSCMPPKIKVANEEKQVEVDHNTESYGKDVIADIKGKPSTDCSNGSVRNICERCVKATKVPSAFRSCCDDISGTREYCLKILDFRSFFGTSHESDINVNRLTQRRRAFGEHPAKPS